MKRVSIIVVAGLVLAGLALHCAKLQNPTMDSDKDACTLCHTLFPAQGAHQRHTSSETYGMSCRVCHLTYNVDNLEVDEALHKNGSYDVEFDTTHIKGIFPEALVVPYNQGSCDNIPCHGFGRKDTFNIVWTTSASWNQTLDCNGCHDTKTNGHYWTGRNCKYCHSVTTTDGIIITDYRKHTNGKVELNKP
jgi:predicted CxxxxCH...CXXCH cytochrome family protein